MAQTQARENLTQPPEDKGSKPIPGPDPVNPEYLFEPDRLRPGAIPALLRFLGDLVRTPAHWVRENVVEPNRGPKYYWYHRKYPRALPIDECYIDDEACLYEANIEYRRGLMVDRATLSILKERRDNCYLWYTTKRGTTLVTEECKGLADTYKREEVNFFIKYGELLVNHTVAHAYAKQKHRMIVERRRRIKEEQEGRPETKPY